MPLMPHRTSPYAILRRLLFAVGFFLLSLLLCACGSSSRYAPIPTADAPVIEPEGSPELTIAVASDLHISSDSGVSVGLDPLYVYNNEVTQAMLYAVENSDADVLILCGDITNGSRPAQHEKLLSFLSRARENGLRILVLNGNHDIDKISPDEFAEYYKDYGYSDAESRDPDSLSYTIRLKDRLLILMDTGGYRGSNLAGDVLPGTLRWLEDRLSEAAQQNLPVLVFGHYPLLTAQAGEFIGCKEMTDLLLRYNVPLYVCGHMHGRNVEYRDGLTELVVEQTIAYPCSYAVLTCYSSGELSYVPHLVDVEGWAAASGVEDPVLLHFRKTQDEALKARCGDLIDILRPNASLSENRVQQAEEFYYEFQVSLSLGRLWRDLENLKKHPGYSAFMELAHGTIYARWLPIQLDRSAVSMEGFLLPAPEG